MEAKKGLAASEVLLTLGFIAFFIPASYAIPGIVFKLWEYYYMAVAIVAVGVLALKHINDINPRYVLLVVYFTWLFFGTQLIVTTRSLAMMTLIKKYLKCVGFVSMLELGFLSFKKQEVVKSFLNAGLIMSFLHFVTFLIYGRTEGGMRHGQAFYNGYALIGNTKQNWYLLTYDNESIFYFLPILALLLYCTWYLNRKTKKLFYLYLGILLFMFIYKTAATAMLGTIGFTVLILYYVAKMKRKRKRRKYEISSFLNYTTAVLGGLTVDIAVVMLAGSKIATKVAGYFGKDADFSGREYIWANSFKFIRMQPLTGVGMESSERITLKLNQTHCHNIIVENLYTGGVIALVLFLLILWFFRPKAKKSFAVIIFAAALATFFVISGLDWLIANPIPWALFYFCYYLSDAEESVWVFLTRRLGLFKKVNI